MAKLQKLVSGFLTVTTSVAITGLGLIGTAYAAPISSASATLSDTAGSATGVAYSVKFTASANPIKAITLEFRTAASAGGVVTGLGVTGSAGTASYGAGAGTPLTGWTYAVSDPAKSVTLSNATAYAPTGAETYTVNLTAIANNSATTNTCDAIADSETCYIRITTFSDTGATTQVDTGAVSYTVINNVTVTATVDPSLSFTVTGVLGTALPGNDSFAGCGAGGATENITTTATSMPFSNLRASTSGNRTYKCAQQSLVVATNAAQGYSVYQKMFAATPAANVAMSGVVNTANAINGFTSAFPAVTAWALPAGTVPSTNTGFLGVRTKNAGVNTAMGGTNFGNTNDGYVTPFINSTGSLGTLTVMKSTVADLGTTPTLVTYKLEVNPAQPSDTYSGAANYNVVALY